jgi:hypothetical protein
VVEHNLSVDDGAIGLEIGAELGIIHVRRKPSHKNLRDVEAGTAATTAAARRPAPTRVEAR